MIQLYIRRNNEAAISVGFLLDANSLAFSLYGCLCVNVYIAKRNTKSACYISSGRCGVLYQVNNPFLKILF